MPKDPIDILKTTALELGFELAGPAAAKRPETYPRFERWVDAGMHAGMRHLAERRKAREHPDAVLPGVRSIFMLGVSYETVLRDADHPVRQLRGIAEYARGIDYHRWVRDRLRRLSARHRELFPDERCRGVVDTAPILERQFAADAGLGRIGKNTMLIHPEFGSKFFLAALLSTKFFEIVPPAPLDFPCEHCRRCLDACPTGALLEPFLLDARHCLNYWTIEHQGAIPAPIVEKIGNRYFGCDICQNVCPWNRKHSVIDGGSIDPRTLPDETIKKMASGSPLERKFRGRPD